MVTSKEEGSMVINSDIVIDKIYAIQATNRQVLIAHINALVDSGFFDVVEGKVYLHVELSGEHLGCEGCSADYATEVDVPYHSVPCICGNPKHWLIKYEEEDTNGNLKGEVFNLS